MRWVWLLLLAALTLHPVGMGSMQHAMAADPHTTHLVVSSQQTCSSATATSPAFGCAETCAALQAASIAPSLAAAQTPSTPVQVHTLPLSSLPACSGGAVSPSSSPGHTRFGHATFQVLRI